MRAAIKSAFAGSVFVTAVSTAKLILCSIFLKMHRQRDAIAIKIVVSTQAVDMASTSNIQVTISLTAPSLDDEKVSSQTEFDYAYQKAQEFLKS
jgi:hypothetical protein